MEWKMGDVPLLGSSKEGRHQGRSEAALELIGGRNPIEIGVDMWE